MPIPKWHACRLVDPAIVNVVGSGERKHDGKAYRVLFATPKSGEGGSTEQGYRYATGSWTAAAARAHCKRHGGTFEPAAPAESGGAHMGGLTAEAVWTTAFVNGLPDSAFLHVRPGGTKDEDGRTVPRANRMFPYRDAGGAVDLPHLRNALARIPQADLPRTVKDRLMAKARGILDREKSAESMAGAGGPEWLQEKIAGAFAEASLADGDGAEKVVRDIALLGARSGNGYRYSEQAMREGTVLYEGRPVYLNHPVGNDVSKRNVRDLCGVVRDPRYEGGRVRGDVVLRGPSVADFLSLLGEGGDGARLAPVEDIGMSQIVLAERDKDDHRVVARIERVLEVDVVAFPATTRTFAEQAVREGEFPGSQEDLRDRMQMALGDHFERAGLLEPPQEGELRPTPWVRAVFDDYVIAELRTEDETELYRVTYEMDAEDNLTFGDPEPVELRVVPKEGRGQTGDALTMDEKALIEEMAALKAAAEQRDGELDALRAERDQAAQELAEAKERVAAVTAERDEAAGKVEKFEAARKLAERKGEILALVDAAELPEAMAPSVATVDTWLKADATDEQVKAALAERQEILEKLAPETAKAKGRDRAADGIDDEYDAEKAQAGMLAALCM